MSVPGVRTRKGGGSDAASAQVTRWVNTVLPLRWSTALTAGRSPLSRGRRPAG